MQAEVRTQPVGMQQQFGALTATEWRMRPASPNGVPIRFAEVPASRYWRAILETGTESVRARTVWSRQQSRSKLSASNANQQLLPAAGLADPHGNRPAASRNCSFRDRVLAASVRRGRPCCGSGS